MLKEHSERKEDLGSFWGKGNFMPKRTFTEKTGYSSKVLIPGYLGELSIEELNILKTELQNRSKLRKRWGFQEGEKITNTKIQEKALEEKRSDYECSKAEVESAK